MTTSAPALAGRRYDRIFFLVMSVAILAVVLVGFAKTYFLAGMIHAPLPDRLIHVHGAIFTSWIILFIIQASLVSARRVDIHKKLGLFGFGLACLMVVFGLLAAKDLLQRGLSPVPGLDPRTFFVVPVADMFVFATLIYFGWALRTRGLDHKRLMLIATVALLDAAFARWPFAFIQGGHIAADLCEFSLLFILAGYDFWSTRKIQKVTLWASLFVIVAQEAKVPIGMTHLWIRFADLVLGKV